MDLEELVEPGDHEDLVDLRIDVGQAELAGAVAHAVVDGDQRAQRGRGEVVDVGEADEQLGGVGPVDQRGDLLADGLDVRLVEDVAIDELDRGDAVSVRDSQPRLSLCHGVVSVKHAASGGGVLTIER